MNAVIQEENLTAPADIIQPLAKEATQPDRQEVVIKHRFVRNPSSFANNQEKSASITSNLGGAGHSEFGIDIHHPEDSAINANCPGDNRSTGSIQSNAVIQKENLTVPAEVIQPTNNEASQPVANDDRQEVVIKHRFVRNPSSFANNQENSASITSNLGGNGHSEFGIDIHHPEDSAINANCPGDNRSTGSIQSNAVIQEENLTAPAEVIQPLANEATQPDRQEVVIKHRFVRNPSSFANNQVKSANITSNLGNAGRSRGEFRIDLHHQEDSSINANCPGDNRSTGSIQSNAVIQKENLTVPAEVIQPTNNEASQPVANDDRQEIVIKHRFVR